jgi:4-hydroxy-2-oxoheptanedioate aldolase
MPEDAALRPNRVKRMLAAGEPAFGLIATIPSVQVVQVLSQAGLDWLLVDMEHAPIDLAAAHSMIVATAGTATVPFARVASAQPWLAKPVLDLGALGIAFPMIRTRAEAESAVRSLRYPPAGDRLWGPFYAPIRWGTSIPGYMSTANEEVMAIVTVEHPDAVRNVDEIMSTPGLDLAFIGPGDLATALEVPGQFDAPRFKAAVAEAEAGILRSRVALGGVARTPEDAGRMLDRGYRAVVLGFDWLLLQRTVVEFLGKIR